MGSQRTYDDDYAGQMDCGSEDSNTPLTGYGSEDYDAPPKEFLNEDNDTPLTGLTDSNKKSDAAAEDFTHSTKENDAAAKDFTDSRKENDAAAKDPTDSTKKSDAAAKASCSPCTAVKGRSRTRIPCCGKFQAGCWQKLWSYKIPFFCFLAVSLILLIVVIILSDHNYGLKKYLCGDIEQESSGCSVCPAGWLWHRESCYYIYSGTEYRSWNKSRETCKRMGANLTIIEDREEKELIKKFSKEQDDKLFWIGMRRDGGVWRWVDGQRYDTNLSQPSEGSSGDCAYLYSGGEFYEYNCTYNNSWICEKKTLKI